MQVAQIWASFHQSISQIGMVEEDGWMDEKQGSFVGKVHIFLIKRLCLQRLIQVVRRNITTNGTSNRQAICANE